MKFSTTGQDRCDLGGFNTGDCLIEVTAWVGLTVYVLYISHSSTCQLHFLIH